MDGQWKMPLKYGGWLGLALWLRKPSFVRLEGTKRLGQEKFGKSSNSEVIFLRPQFSSFFNVFAASAVSCGEFYPASSAWDQCGLRYLHVFILFYPYKISSLRLCRNWICCKSQPDLILHHTLRMWSRKQLALDAKYTHQPWNRTLEHQSRRIEEMNLNHAADLIARPLCCVT